MQAKRWYFVDKSCWGDGPWSSEPDKEQWTDPGTGLACLVVRNWLGSLCGYVGVPEEHPWHGRSLTEIDEEFPTVVHGGLTFSDFCQEDNREFGICHVPEPEDPDPVWWIGFDCGHAFDLQPGQRAREVEWCGRPFAHDPDQEYRDLAYVKANCMALAAQVIIAGGRRG